MATKMPIATNSNTGWTLTGAATIHECLDEGIAAADDGATRVAANANGSVFSVGMETMENPNETVSGSLIVYMRCTRSALVGDPAVQFITLTLKSAGLTFATVSWDMNTFVSGWYTLSYTPTQAELLLITDYDDIDVECSLNITAGTTLRVSVIEVFVATRTLRAFVMS